VQRAEHINQPPLLLHARQHAAAAAASCCEVACHERNMLCAINSRPEVKANRRQQGS
jgi:hypothetical protein